MANFNKVGNALRAAGFRTPNNPGGGQRIVLNYTPPREGDEDRQRGRDRGGYREEDRDDDRFRQGYETRRPERDDRDERRRAETYDLGYFKEDTRFTNTHVYLDGLGWQEMPDELVPQTRERINSAVLTVSPGSLINDLYSAALRVRRRRR